MAPNNALTDRTKTKKKEEDKPSEEDRSRTTVLEKGIVESRGMGTMTNSRKEIHQTIQTFINGEAKLSWKSELRCFFTVFTFITRLPGPIWVDHHPRLLDAWDGLFSIRW